MINAVLCLSYIHTNDFNDFHFKSEKITHSFPISFETIICEESSSILKDKIITFLTSLFEDNIISSVDFFNIIETFATKDLIDNFLLTNLNHIHSTNDKNIISFSTGDFSCSISLAI